MSTPRDAGRVVIVGQYTDHGDVSYNPHLDLNRKHLDVRGCWGSDFSHFYRGVQIMADADRAAPWKRVRTADHTLDTVNEAMAEVEQGEVVKALVRP